MHLKLVKKLSHDIDLHLDTIGRGLKDAEDRKEYLNKVSNIEITEDMSLSEIDSILFEFIIDNDLLYK